MRILKTRRGRRVAVSVLVAGVVGGWFAGCTGTHPLAPGVFGVTRFEISARNVDGTRDVQAGSHPYALTSTFLFNEAGPSSGDVKDLQLELPPGIVGNPDATPKCTYQEFSKGLVRGESSGCGNESAVGLATSYIINTAHPHAVFPTTDAVYNLVPPPGVAAEFGFVALYTTPVLLQESVRTGSDYGVTTYVPDVNQGVVVDASKVTIWGVPAEAVHDPWRGSCERNLAGQEVEETTPGAGLREAGGEDELEGPLYGEEGVGGMPESLGSCGTGASLRPLLTMPTSCGRSLTATLRVDSWEEAHGFEVGEGPRTKSASLPELAGCENLNFTPTLNVKPDGTAGSTPTGLNVGVEQPQEASISNPNGLSEADLKDATVTLPAGVQLDPSAADGLQACTGDPSDLEAGKLGSPGDQIGFTGVNPESGLKEFTSAVPGSVIAEQDGEDEALKPGENFCPLASKIASVTIKSPDLEGDLTGAVYLATPQNFLGGPLENPFMSLVAMYLVVEEPKAGVLAKLPGKVSLSESGQITTTFEDLPQFPVTETKFEFYGTDRAPLATPAQCGSYATTSAFTSWDGEAQNPSSEFSIDSGPNGSACTYPGQALPFSPSLSSGVPNINAGAFSDLTTTLSREDGQQHIQQVTLHYPAGLSGILSGVELCAEAQANAGTCGAGSEIGETIVSVGLGDDPFAVTGGKVYLTGPYDGAPFGLSIENPAKAGPFDLQEGQPVVVRAKIEVNRTTAALTVVTNTAAEGHAIPNIIDGIPLQIKHVNVNITRPGFTFNPTSCNPTSVTGSVGSSEGASSPVSIPFQVTNCGALKFTPKFSVSTSGKTSKSKGASLTAKLSEPSEAQGSQANITKVKVELPKQLPSRLTTLQKACTNAQFEANPAGCPSESKIGYATVHTPLLPVPLTGPAIFVSHGGEAFPSLTMVLQGYGVTVDLVGTTFISKAGVTSTTFKTVPDVPFSTFELTLPEGKYSALAANGSLCKDAGKLKMPTEFIGQNGMKLTESETIAVAGCAKVKALTRAQKLQKALKACRAKDRKKAKREKCEKAARKAYGPIKKSKRDGKKK
jgi:hypothetical protein